ncbi:MAG: SMP-30/gluconolactonase/LRE family protein [Wenzhouxiangellaceae bacterium]
MKRICLALFSLALACSVHADTSASAEPRAVVERVYSQVALVPADHSLVRPEDGVSLSDGTLLIADQVHGLVALSPDGTKRPFGNFASAGYVHEPPERSAGPNGVALEPDGIHVLVADVLTGAIYRVNTESENVKRIHQHEFGANSARRDRTGALWFTQSTENNGPDSEARMFAAVDTNPLDGAVFRIAPADDHEPYPEPERKVSGLVFANGLAIDEVRNQLYVAETMADRIIGYRLSVASGTLSERRVVANVPTPDNIELDESGRLWVASPIANALLVVDPESGEWSTAFHPQTPEHDRLMTEWNRRTKSGEPRLELFGPDMWLPLPGLITGLILTTEGGPIYLTGLGDSLVKLDRLPDPVEAGWKGASVCEVLHDDAYQRVLRCTFPSTVGHERHYHKRHFGYVIAGGRMQITDATGTRVVEPATGAHFKSDGIGWHEVVNIGETAATYLIMEPK